MSNQEQYITALNLYLNITFMTKLRYILHLEYHTVIKVTQLLKIANQLTS